VTTGEGRGLTGGVSGIGVDAVDVQRFRAVLGRRPAMVERLFTPGECRHVSRSADPVPRLAARFAAKEAVLKALGVGLGSLGWREVEVVVAPGGAPRLALTGRAAALAGERSVARWHVSLTHTDLVAVASVVAELAP
jgi:phosphopantetheine--protein transferase-like protein